MVQRKESHVANLQGSVSPRNSLIFMDGMGPRVARMVVTTMVL